MHSTTESPALHNFHSTRAGRAQPLETRDCCKGAFRLSNRYATIVPLSAPHSPLAKTLSPFASSRTQCIPQLVTRRTQYKMSSPSQRRTTRNSQARSSPAQGSRTPRATRSSQLASSPLFYQSSDGPEQASSPLIIDNGDGSSAAGTPAALPSSPLRQFSNSQSTNDASRNDGDRTPRATGRGGLMGGMSNMTRIGQFIHQS